MTDLRLEGRARIVGDDVNTDYIITSRRKRDSLDPKVLRQYLLETVDPAFAASVRPGDILVAGKNFGCGSAMEVAATVVLGAGISAVLATSFSRTYYRNAINNGLFPIVCETSAISEGDTLEIAADQEITVRNETTGQSVVAQSLPSIVRRIVMAGGLVPYFRQHGD
ncbi:MAG: 3-isopropylmalate dehydratase, partial [Rhodospirillales bacterium]